jgi:hypothetical protein
MATGRASGSMSDLLFMLYQLQLHFMKDTVVDYDFLLDRLAGGAVRVIGRDVGRITNWLRSVL